MEIKLVWLQLTFLKFMTKVTKQNEWKLVLLQVQFQNLGFVGKTSCWRFVIVLGGTTGRMELAVTTGSSKEQDKTSIHTMSSEVQKGNAGRTCKNSKVFRNP